MCVYKDDGNVGQSSCRVCKFKLGAGGGVRRGDCRIRKFEYWRVNGHFMSFFYFQLRFVSQLCFFFVCVMFVVGERGRESDIFRSEGGLDF